MELLLYPLGGVFFLIWWAVQTVLLRAICRWVASAELSWPMSALSALLAASAQLCATGVLLGGDGGCFGSVVGWLVWSAVLSFLNGLAFARALLVGLVMAAVNWLTLPSVTGVLLLTVRPVIGTSGTASTTIVVVALSLLTLLLAVTVTW